MSCSGFRGYMIRVRSPDQVPEFSRSLLQTEIHSNYYKYPLKFYLHISVKHFSKIFVLLYNTYTVDLV